MASATNVARYLIHRAAAEEEPEYLTHLRLQKLLYYAQGWSLALRDQALFPERIEAWANGPVVKDVFPVFAGYKSNVIPPEATPEAENLSQDEAEFIESVWEALKGYSAISLWRMTHAESPWIEARGNLGPGDRCDTEITPTAMAKFFAQSDAEPE